MTTPTALPPTAFPMTLVVALAAALLAGGCAPGGDRSAGANSAEFVRRENERAMALIEQRKFDEAEPILKSVINADPTYWQARNNLGLVYYQIGNLHQSAWEFDEAARLNPRRPEPHNNLGLVLERAGKLTGATDAYGRAVQLDPGNAEYLGNLARVRVRQGENSAGLRQLLEELILRETRPQWQEWARRTLLRLRAAPASQPDGPGEGVGPK